MAEFSQSKDRDDLIHALSVVDDDADPSEKAKYQRAATDTCDLESVQMLRNLVKGTFARLKIPDDAVSPNEVDLKGSVDKPDTVKIRESIDQSKDAALLKALLVEIGWFEISMRTYNVLKKEDCNFIGDLLFKFDRKKYRYSKKLLAEIDQMLRWSSLSDSTTLNPEAKNLYETARAAEVYYNNWKSAHS